MSRRFTVIIIVVNLFMGLLIFLSSELVLFAIDGTIVKRYGIFISRATPTDSIINSAPMAAAPLPDLPLFLFLFSLVINLILLVKVLKTNTKAG